MNHHPEIKTYSEFDEYYTNGQAQVRSKHPDFHIFRFNELGNSVVKEMGPFKTEYYQFALGSSLKSSVSIFDKELIVEEFSMVIYLPGQIIKWERTGNWDGYVINVKEHFINKALLENKLDSFQFLHDMRPLVIKLKNTEYEGLSNIYEMLMAEHQHITPENLNVIKNLMNVLLVYIGRIIKDSNEAHLSEGSFSYIHHIDIAKNFKNLVFRKYLLNKSVSYYAEELGISAAALNIQVKKVFNKSPKEFINEVILLHAQTILKNPNSSVKEVCYDLNFDDYSHFVKFFKRMTGITPAEYKNQSH